MELGDLRYTIFDTDVGNSKSVQKLDIYVYFVIPIFKSRYFMSEERFVMIILTCFVWLHDFYNLYLRNKIPLYFFLIIFYLYFGAADIYFKDYYYYYYYYYYY